jgi:hypothetical protein
MNYYTIGTLYRAVPIMARSKEEPSQMWFTHHGDGLLGLEFSVTRRTNKLLTLFNKVRRP